MTTTTTDDDDNDEFEIEDDTIVFCQEMNDNHIEEHTFKELVAFCACGKNDPDAGGNWTSISDGNYLQNNDDDDVEEEEEGDDDTDSNNNNKKKKKKKKKTISSSDKSSPLLRRRLLQLPPCSEESKVNSSKVRLSSTNATPSNQ